ncbi:nucleotidyltransferase domain-containing protein [Candidatus Woesearchaeota archaeon]|nr:nucleotidyltransferase domain-containing protein [Candidatus Woesearchaeota archaeon]
MTNKLTTIRALIPFLTQPEKLHVSSIARTIAQPVPTTRLWLQELARQGVLHVSHRGRQTLYELQAHPNLIDYLVIAEKAKLLEHCSNPSFQHFVEEVQHCVEGKALIFGSAAENYHSAGDIDLLIIGKIQRKKVKKVATLIGKKVHLVVLPTLVSISAIFRAEVIRKHLLISGSEEFLKWMQWPVSNGARNNRKA